MEHNSKIMQNKTHTQQLLHLARDKGILRTCDLKNAGIPRVYLTRLIASGQLERTERGLYRLPDNIPCEQESLMLIATKVPQAIFCLLTALQFHELTTQLPYQVWIAMPRGSHIPQIQYPPLKMIQCLPDVHMQGVEIFEKNQVKLRVYGVSKTIVDCFKYRNKIGIDVAVEALKQAIDQKKVNIDELWHYAKICRVTNVMRPYLEALT